LTVGTGGRPLCSWPSESFEKEAGQQAHELDTN
jgi:hypothetical protein